MKIQQFRYASDNLGYLIFGRHTAVAIDGGAVSDIVAFLSEKGLRLAYATNTHSHADHTTGTKDLLKQTDAAYIDIPTLRQKEEIDKKALQKEVSDLKSEMSDIKSLLLTLVQKAK